MDRQAESPAKAWYLVQCKSRQDGRALEHLQRQNFECFAPTRAVQSICAGKLRELEQPLFPGYLFIRMGEGDSWLSLRSTRGVNRVVAFCGQPCCVQDSIIDQLRQRCGGTPAVAAFKPGDAVQVKIGEDSEVDAIFLSMDGDERVMLLLKILNREHQIQVRLASILPAQQGAAVPLQ